MTATQIISCLLRKEEETAGAGLGLICPVPSSKGWPCGSMPGQREKLSGEIKQADSATVCPWASHYLHWSQLYSPVKRAKQYLRRGRLQKFK